MILSKLILAPSKHPHAHFQYAHDMSSKSEKHPLKPFEELIKQIRYPKVQNAAKMAKFKRP